MTTNYNKMGDGTFEEKPKPIIPRPTPAQLAKRQREVNQERLKAIEEGRPPNEGGIVRPRESLPVQEQSKGKRTKEEREREFIVAVEMMLGHPLFEWQKDWLKEIRKASFEGRPLNVTLEEVRRRRGH